MPLPKLTIYASLHARAEKLHIDQDPSGSFLLSLFGRSPAEMNAQLSAEEATALRDFLNDALPGGTNLSPPTLSMNRPVHVWLPSGERIEAEMSIPDAEKWRRAYGR